MRHEGRAHVALQAGAARAAAVHVGVRIGAAQQRVDGGAQDLQGSGGEGQRQAFDDGFFALERDDGAVVDAAAQAPRPPAVEAELVQQLPFLQATTLPMV